MFLTQLLPVEHAPHPRRTEVARAPGARRLIRSLSDRNDTAAPCRATDVGRAAAAGSLEDHDDRLTGGGIGEHHRLADRIDHRCTVDGDIAALDEHRRLRGHPGQRAGRLVGARSRCTNAPATRQPKPWPSPVLRCRPGWGSPAAVVRGGPRRARSRPDRHRRAPCRPGRRTRRRPTRRCRYRTASPDRHRTAGRVPGMISAASPVAVTRPSESITH